jgi:hypothetical protein
LTLTPLEGYSRWGTRDRAARGAAAGIHVQQWLDVDGIDLKPTARRQRRASVPSVQQLSTLHENGRRLAPLLGHSGELLYGGGAGCPGFKAFDFAEVD